MFSFLSVEFALLFIAFFAIYWACRSKPAWQNMLLLGISYVLIYLMAGVLAVLVLLVFSVLIGAIGQVLSAPNAKHKKLWLVVGVLFTLANLAFFKYYEFFREHISQVMQMQGLDSTHLVANIIFPLGISYYSFQAISYLVTIYQGKLVLPKLTLWQTLTHFSFFATISAGPITRLTDTKGLNDITGNPCGMHAQWQTSRPRHIIMPTLAFALILLALAKKWWLAGYLADQWVNPVFANPTGFHSLEVLAAIYGYTLQLFLDFSGYSEMMVAFGLLLGFRLPMNFNAPLLAHNIREFWDRWHISLSTWIRDYIYIPLGGSHHGFVRTQLNLMIAMVLSGIWHGSTLNFLFWGLLHAIAIILLNVGDLLGQKITGNPKGRNFLTSTGIFGQVVGVVVTVHFVVFAFVFFRATTFDEALMIFGALFGNHHITWTNNPMYLLFILAAAWLCYPMARTLAIKTAPMIAKIPSVLIYPLLFVGFMMVVIFAPSGIPGFIYANF
ncbi:MBOAT family protein [Moraxella nasovis]|uniref:MBOAT family O-acyltransferase n=1 Tax=Moraxella nasovis TaxID=2904121 RepID=UPI001F604000|nr:MBOAT family O-acyltransferase [Moraxella nasovis]UNU73256.1 MBOAT family protein [Moraxella nasovis]